MGATDREAGASEKGTGNRPKGPEELEKYQLRLAVLFKHHKAGFRSICRSIDDWIAEGIRDQSLEGSDTAPQTEKRRKIHD